MIANNVFRVIADLFTNILFVPYDAFRSTDGWWGSNVLNATFISIGAILFLYWLGQLQKFRRAGAE